MSFPLVGPSSRPAKPCLCASCCLQKQCLSYKNNSAPRMVVWMRREREREREREGGRERERAREREWVGLEEERGTVERKKEGGGNGEREEEREGEREKEREGGREREKGEG